MTSRLPAGTSVEPRVKALGAVSRSKSLADSPGRSTLTFALPPVVKLWMSVPNALCAQTRFWVGS